MSNRKRLLDTTDSSYGGSAGALGLFLMIGGILAGIVLGAVSLGLQQTSQNNIQSEIATLANVSFYSTPVNVISANFTENSTPKDVNNYVTPVFDTIIETTAQQGFSWNTTSGIGTCLIGGTYEFTWSLSILVPTGTRTYFSVILHNNAPVVNHNWSLRTQNDYEPINGSFDTQSFPFNLKVSIGDQLEFRVEADSYPLRSALFGYSVRQ